MTVKDQLIYRELEIGDYKTLLQLWADTPLVHLRDYDSEEKVTAFLDQHPGLSIAVLSRNQLIGGVLVGHDGRNGFIYHLVVSRAYRHEGIGAQLIEMALANLKEKGI